MREREYTGNRAAYIGALQLIARRLEVTTLRPAQYEEARQEMLKKSRGRHREELMERLHAAGAIDAHGWDELLASAGLVPRKREGVSPGLPVPDAVERFLEAQGRLPKLLELHRFAKERGFALQTTKKILPHIEELRSRRTKEGRWTPARVPKPSQRPPWQAPEPGASEDPEHPRPRRGHWTLEHVQAGLQLALAELAPGETLTLPTLRRLAKANRDIPSSGTVGRTAKEHGTTITALRLEAIQRRHSATQ